MSRPLDGRREAALLAELRQRAAAVFGANADAIEPGEVLDAMLSVAARIGEEVAKRLDLVPDKQAGNFYSAMGQGREPPTPAKVPVAFRLSDTAADRLIAPAGTRLSATIGKPVSFETAEAISLARGKLTNLCAADFAGDQIVLSPPGPIAPSLPHKLAMRRQLLSDVGAGASEVQVDPPHGLAKGMALRIGDPADEDDVTVTKVEGNVVTVEPSLAQAHPRATVVEEVTRFAPFSPGAHDRQGHYLYLGHASLLDIPSETAIVVSGIASGDFEIEWAWFGKATPDAEKPDWQPIEGAKLTPRGDWVLQKPAGKPEKTSIGGHSSLWLRARLPGASSEPRSARSLRLMIGGTGDCASGEPLECPTTEAGVEFEAIAVAAPAVTSKPFHPFGPEPRQFDSFYIGSEEAFGKIGARVRLCFAMGGASLGPLAVVADGNAPQVFGVGTDGQLYRATLGPLPSFVVVPAPGDLAAGGFPSQAAVDARLDSGIIRVAVAGTGSVHTTTLNAGGAASAGTITWQTLKGDEPSAAVVAGEVFVTPEAGGTILARFDERVLSWENLSAKPPASVVADAFDLIRVQGAASPVALLLSLQPNGKIAPSLRPLGAAPALPGNARFAPTLLPETNRAAWVGPAGDYYLGGFADSDDAERPLSLIKLDGASPAATTVGTLPALPIGFEPPYGVSQDWPTVVLATPDVTRRAFDGTDWHNLPDSDRVGASTSANPARRMITVAGVTVIQHPDQGLFYRAAGNPRRSIDSLAIEGSPGLTVTDPALASFTGYLVPTGAANGLGFEPVQSATNPNLQLLLPLSDAGPDIPDRIDANWQATVRLLLPMLSTGGPEALTIDSLDEIVLDLDPFQTTPTPTAWIALTSTDNSGGTQRGIWELTHSASTANWDKPTGFPDHPGTTHSYLPLQELPAGGGSSAVVLLDGTNTEPAFATDQAAIDRLFADRQTARLLLDDNIAVTHSQVENFAAWRAIPVERRWDGSEGLRFVNPVAPWSALGPNQPANPDLSWEYWNGTSWWTLDGGGGLRDTTADLLSDGGVFFSVPADLQQTEVSGRKNRWIRARLIGGDYGQPRVTSVSKPGPDGSTVSEVVQDRSTIRAPHVLKLSVSYCAMSALRPELVITADNLATLDQTGANQADLPVQLFAPVRTVLYPPATADDDGRETGCECCETWNDPQPAPPTPAPTQQLSRAIFFGFDQPPLGDVVSLYCDAEPTGRSTTLAALSYRAGRFEELDIHADATSGLNESGVLQLRISAAPDRVELFGQSAYWIALGPLGEPEKWAPRLRGLYLNGVEARSVETRRNEALGSSSGAPDQTFRLVLAPIDPDSLELYVSEPVGKEDAQRLGALDEIEGRPGPWVPWQRVSSLPSLPSGTPARLYTVNALTGELCFGDGKSAVAPPMGSALLARSYRAVTGEGANGLAPGAKLQPVSPIAGIDAVLGLDNSRGGANAETFAQARGRAPAKLRHGDRIVTLADLEEFVRARQVWVAQARASNVGRAIRLLVVQRGPQPVAAPATLRGLAELIAAHACYAIGAPGRLSVVAPRLLPVRISLEIERDPGADRAQLMDDARRAIERLLDHERGGHDGQGWPVGVRLTETDIAAALGDMLEQATLCSIGITRDDGLTPLPAELPSDVLLRLDPDAVDIALAKEDAA